MFHYRLIELESELLAKEQSQKGIAELKVECLEILAYIERQVGLELAWPVPAKWRGWLTYRRRKDSLIVCRGRAFKPGAFAKWRAGLDMDNGGEVITEHQRGFDITPPQDLDHLLINFGENRKQPRVFLWYGENIAPYKLIFQADVESDPHIELSEAIVEACTWIMTRPKEQTLSQFLETLAKKKPG